MFNLLTNILKEKIRAEYNLRRFILMLVFILFLQISFLVFLFPSWILSVYKEKNVASEIDEMNKSSAVLNVNQISSIIKSTNIKLKVINTALEYQKVVSLVDIILSKKTASVHLDGILYTSISKSAATISIEGISSTREGLVSFVKGLEKSELFKTVDLPVSDLAKDKNIKFSISLSTG